MADLSTTPGSVLASANATISLNGTAGATIVAGKAVYLDSTDNKLKLADSNGAAALQAVVGVALNGASDGQPVAYVAADPDFTPGATVTEGVPYFLSNTAGGICPAADLAAGSKSVFLGIGKAGNKMNLQIVAGGVTQG